MHFVVVCVIFIIYGCHNGNGRVLINTKTIQAADSPNETAVIHLPAGFNPQTPPVHPLLYPFATETSESRASTSGWKPIVNTINGVVSTQVTNTSPMRQEQLSDAIEFPPDHYTSPITVMEAVVYGTWKPQPPLKPDEILNSASSEYAENHSYDSVETIPNVQYSDSINRENHKKYPADMELEDENGQSTNRQDDVSFENHDSSSKRPTRKSIGRKKIPTGTLSKTIADFERDYAGTPPNVIKVNTTDSHLLSVAKEINHSAEKSKTYTTGSHWAATVQPWTVMPKTQAPTEQQDEPVVTTAEMTKNWPTDFIAVNGTEMIKQASPFPQLGLNITKLGIPYEDGSVAEDNTRICVPLTISEQSPLNKAEAAESERIYCFPLPTPNAENRDANDTGAIDYEAVHSASAKALSTCCKIIAMYICLLVAAKNLVILQIQ